MGILQTVDSGGLETLPSLTISWPFGSLRLHCEKNWTNKTRVCTVASFRSVWAPGALVTPSQAAAVFPL